MAMLAIYITPCGFGELNLNVRHEAI